MLELFGLARLSVLRDVEAQLAEQTKIYRVKEKLENAQQAGADLQERLNTVSGKYDRALGEMDGHGYKIVVKQGRGRHKRWRFELFIDDDLVAVSPVKGCDDADSAIAQAKRVLPMELIGRNVYIERE